MQTLNQLVNVPATGLYETKPLLSFAVGAIAKLTFAKLSKGSRTKPSSLIVRPFFGRLDRLELIALITGRPT